MPEKLSWVVNIEMFRWLLKEQLINQNKWNNAGACQVDFVLKFKILILNRYYGLRYSKIELQILDRCNFKWFIGLNSGVEVPDWKTVRAFREKLTKSG